MMPQPGGVSVQAGLERENLARRLAEGAAAAFARLRHGTDLAATHQVVIR